MIESSIPGGWVSLILKISTECEKYISKEQLPSPEQGTNYLAWRVDQFVPDHIADFPEGANL